MCWAPASLARPSQPESGSPPPGASAGLDAALPCGRLSVNLPVQPTAKLPYVLTPDQGRHPMEENLRNGLSLSKPSHDGAARKGQVSPRVGPREPLLPAGEGWRALGPSKVAPALDIHMTFFPGRLPVLAVSLQSRGLALLPRSPQLLLQATLLPLPPRAAGHLCAPHQLLPTTSCLKLPGPHTQQRERPG